MTKGSVLDIIFIPVALLFLGILIFVSVTIWSNISPQLAATSSIAANTTASATTALNTFNWTFLIIAFALGAASVIYAYMSPSHPIFFVIGLILLVISMVTTAVMSNVFGLFSSETTIASATGSFTIINWFMSNALTIFMAVFGMLMLIVLYTRLSSGRE